MRMSTHHFLVDVAAHVIDRELARISRDLALQHHLQQHVAQLFAQMGRIVRLNGIDSLVGLFNHVVRNARVRLLAIPRTTIGRAQLRNRFNERIEFRMVCHCRTLSAKRIKTSRIIEDQPNQVSRTLHHRLHFNHPFEESAL